MMSAENGQLNGVKPRLAVIDYGMGNLRSVCKAWEHVGAAVQLVNSPSEIKAADGLIFPGQGAIVDAMKLLKSSGFDRVICEWIEADRPFFGICLGMQALFEHSEEGDTQGLGILPGNVTRFQFPKESGLKVPHMGWNTVRFERKVGVPAVLPEDPYFYFVHSYQVGTLSADWVWGTTDYGGHRFCSAIQQGRCFATQFHPEKSQANGLNLYHEFLESL